MPYKAEKIKICGTQYDRRRKLSEDQKEYIRRLREEEHLSQRKLAAMFGVSRRLITFIISPEKEAQNRDSFIKRKAEGRYKYSKEEWAQTIREHRQYKHKLHIEGKI